MAAQLTGTRIRERRTAQGIKQRDLAEAAGISASYLNLIEHNRRRIGGRVLNEIARALDLDPTSLSEGAPESLIADLEAGRARFPDVDPGAETATDLAQRFPGWAQLFAAQSRRLDALERQVAALSDRIANDPELQASVHEVLSVVTSIRSSASILVGGENLDRDWEERFYRNIFDDSQRLSESSQALAQYLEAPKGEETASVSPWERLNAWLDGRGHHVADLEEPGAGDPAALFERLTGMAGPYRGVAAAFARRYHGDAMALPVSDMLAEIDRHGLDPGAIARATGRPLVQVMRRLASLPATPENGVPPIGLALSDAAGNLTQLKTFRGFAMPATGPRCPLWPLFGALAQPMRPLRATVALPGSEAPRLSAYAVAVQDGPDTFDDPPLLSSTMIVIADAPRETPLPVGRACRVCPRADCRARREPAIGAQEF